MPVLNRPYRVVVESVGTSYHATEVDALRAYRRAVALLANDHRTIRLDYYHPDDGWTLVRERQPIT